MRYFALRGANGGRWLVLPVLLVLSLCRFASANELVDLPSVPQFMMSPIGQYEPGIDLEERQVLRQVSKLVEADKFTEARVELKLALSRSGDAALWYTLAGIEQQLGDLKAAAQALESALQLLPEFTRAQVQLAGILTLQKRYVEARPWLQKALARQASAPLYGMLGYGYLLEAEYLPARAAYQQALLLDADNREYQKALLQLSLAMDDLAGAEQALNLLIKSDPSQSKKEAELYLLRANLALRQGHDIKAINSLTLAQSLSDDHKQRRAIDWQLSQLYLKNGLHENALPALYAVVNAGTLPPWPELIVTLNYLLQQQQHQAVSELATKLMQQKNLPQVQQSQLYVLMGKGLVSEGKSASAVKKFTQALSLDALNGDALIELALLKQQAQPQTAEQLLQRAADIPETQIRALTLLAQLLVEQQRHDRALLALKQVSHLAPDTPGLEQNLQVVTNLTRLSR